MITKDPQTVGRHVDPFQDQAINCRDLGIRIVAPAGSGKTETLVRRAIKRIASSEVQPSRMLVLSFDNSAKRSFEQKFSRLASRVAKPEITTINAFGNHLLRRKFPDLLGELMKPRSSEQDEFRQWVRRELDHPDVLTWDGRYRSLTDAFTGLKQQGILPLEAESARARQWLQSHFLSLPDSGESFSVESLWTLDQTVTPIEEQSIQIAAIFQAYIVADNYMRERGWMDYEDQKLRPVKVLQKNAAVRDALRSCYDEIVVDECQDINRLEALLIYYVTGSATTLVLAGDDDQSLYEFKEASSLYLREPERFFGDRVFATCHLNINYRSPEEILQPAQKLIENNSARLPKEPKSGVTHSGLLETHVAAADRAHDDLLAERIETFIGNRGVTGSTIEPHDIAVLCPNDDIKRRMQRALQRRRISTAVITTDGRRQEGGVFVDTMRLAKGRQWPVVVLPASEDSHMPGERSVRVGDMESQRRQFYVAMTRPTERLIIGYVRDGADDEIYTTPKGEVLTTNGASRFLFEAGIAKPVEPTTSGASDSLVDQHADPSPPTSLTADEARSKPDKSVAPVPTAISAEVRQPPIVNEPASVPASPLDTVRPTANSTKGPKAVVRSSSDSRIRGSVPGIPPSTKPCDLSVKELVGLEQAAKFLKNTPPDFKYAMLEAWTVMQNVLRRVADPHNQRMDAFKNIEALNNRGVLDDQWANSLHTWRKLRTAILKEDKDIGKRESAIIEQMVHQTAAAIDHIRQRLERKHPLLIEDQRIVGIERLITCIQTGSPHPLTRKPVRALRFRPVEDARDMLILQMLTVLRDVRYYIPVDYRWSTSPIFARVSNDLLGYCHASIRGSGRHRFNVFNPSQTTEVVDLLKQVVLSELGTPDCGSTLARVFDDARAAGNGDYPVGLKLNPKRT